MSDTMLPKAIRRRLEVLTAVGLATVSPPTDPTGPTAADATDSRPPDGGESRGR
ncbi:hypothetical protein HTZ84_03895 [Haloterrigena sp. SYSU A558-1]|uniref:Uncharacterized protein n=1 Tax=Haloterrigena gelatinilytica TaxID=2741724 RepID=A0ABX2LAB2_9EURY|nr:hypothetical protein [Haloterrigena gelatinilytica]NUC71460.1 hypothetical protein [Haloterrigena gelatinilytica]